jgi:amidase
MLEAVDKEATMATDLWRWSAADLAQAISAKQLSAREVVQAHLDRIAAVNHKLNAVTAVLGESALAAADAADRALASGAALGPLHGVPITVKENIELIGSAYTEGVLALKDALPPVDAPHVAQMKAAGAIPIGRTNLPDFGLRWHTDNALHGATRNPWNPTRTPGGSSGGEAAALATGMTPLGLGNDYGGSLRWPSQCCGTAAIRPTLGRVAFHSGLAPAEAPLTIQLFAVQGPMARHVRDLRLGLAAMSGPDARDPWWTPAPLSAQAPAGRRRVAMTSNPGGSGVDPAVAAGVQTAARALAAAGYEVVEVDPPAVAEASDLWLYLVGAELRTLMIPGMQPLLGADAQTFLDLVLASTPNADLAGYMGALAARNTHARNWSQFFSQYDLVLGPVSTQQPFEIGFDLTSSDNVMKVAASLSLVVTCNLLGLPAAVVPVGVADGQPQAVQVIGSRYQEAACLDAAEAIEAALGIITPIDPV